MQDTIIKRFALAAKRDGLTLTWSLNLLREKLEQAERQMKRDHERDNRLGDGRAEQLRLESEALALVMAAVLKAYPAGADITIE